MCGFGVKQIESWWFWPNSLFVLGLIPISNSDDSTITKTK